MKWVRDNSGRFRERPHYHPDELERLCEDTMTRFLWDRHGRVAFPVSTDDLTVLLEREVDDLDNGCVLEDGVDGLTDFFPRRKPHVKIASRLQAPNYENRLRTTLTHECGHVLLHGFLFAGEPRKTRNTCHRDAIAAPSSDWMEWQAGYACGALLMPRTEFVWVVRAFRATEGLMYSNIAVGSEVGQAMIAASRRRFTCPSRLHECDWNSGEYWSRRRFLVCSASFFWHANTLDSGSAVWRVIMEDALRRATASVHRDSSGR